MNGQTDGWTSAVRRRTGLGRLLPLGGPRDGAWITEDAARAVLRGAVRGLPGVRLGALRLGPADPEGAYEAVVPPPPSALAPGPLRMTADFAAVAAEPLPTVAARLREALATAASRRLGLVVTEVDLRVTALLDDLGEIDELDEGPGEAVGGGGVPGGDEAVVDRAARGVPGVIGTTGVLGRAVRLEERAGSAAAALPRRHARVEVAVAASRRTLDVAREVRAAVAEALADRPTVAVLVTDVR